MSYLWHSYTSYDRQRIFMEEHVGNKVRTKRYVGNCEYVTKTQNNVTDERWLTYLTGPTGVYAVVMTKNGQNQLFYVLKDNLGSWTTITDENGEVVQELSYDAWGSLRDPNTWSGSFTNAPIFDRGFTSHEHLTSFGLINMNGRMYDPVMSSFLSVDQYVSSPENAQGFNRYAYCMNNPLRYVDPSGWLTVGGGGHGYTPNSATNDPYAYVDNRYLEPRDFCSAYGMFNMEFYGNTSGFGAGIGAGGGYLGSYGYQVTHHANSVYNHYFKTALLSLIQDWQANPSRSTGEALVNAGITNLTVGEVYGSYQGNPGYRNSYYSWTVRNGNTHTAETLGEFVDGNRNGVYIISNLPLDMYYRRYHQTIERIGFAPYEVGDYYATSQKAYYKMNYNAIVDLDKSSIYVNANSYNTLVVNGTVKPYAKAFLYNNNQIIDSKPLLYSGESILNCDGYCFVGFASFSLPSSGSVELKIEGGWCICFYPCGYYTPTFMGIGINSNTCFNLRNHD